MSSQRSQSGKEITLEEGSYRFQLFHGSVQPKRGLIKAPASVKDGVLKYIQAVLASGEPWSDNPTIYVHSAENSSGDDVLMRAWWSSVGDPREIDSSLRVNHLDDYVECVYVRRKDEDYILIPGLKEAPKRANIGTGTTFAEAVMNKLEHRSPSTNIAPYRRIESVDAGTQTTAPTSSTELSYLRTLVKERDSTIMRLTEKLRQQEAALRTAESQIRELSERLTVGSNPSVEVDDDRLQTL